MYWATHRHSKNRNKKYDIAIETFKEEAKLESVAYFTGFHKWNHNDVVIYALVIYRLRFMIYKYDDNFAGDCI